VPDDLAGPAYWDGVWGDEGVAAPIDPRAGGVRNSLNRRFDRFFRDVLAPLGRGSALLEAGCAHSRWLPYFALELGFEVCGVDYSASGCAGTRQVLERAGVPAEVVQADFFQPPPQLAGRFDVVVSFGVVEHYRDTAGVIRALSRFLRPGGLMVTQVPNMVGMVGTLQRWFNRPVFEKHVPLSTAALEDAHHAGGLDVESCQWFAFANFGVVNLGGLPAGGGREAKRLVTTALVALSAGAWALEDRGVRLPPNRRSSPYVVCVARKPLGA
jgi:SAM-dependent methyltransferase